MGNQINLIIPAFLHSLSPQRNGHDHGKGPLQRLNKPPQRNGQRVTEPHVAAIFEFMQRLAKRGIKNRPRAQSSIKR